VKARWGRKRKVGELTTRVNLAAAAAVSAAANAVAPPWRLSWSLVPGLSL
jgi:hypothetical protein